MKQFTRTSYELQVMKVNKTEYVAFDGTIFHTKQECEEFEKRHLIKYEEEYKKYIKCTTTADELFDCGNDIYEIDLIYMPTQQALYAVLNMYDFYNYDENDIQQCYDLINNAYQTNSTLMVGRNNCEKREFSLYPYTLEQHIDSILKFADSNYAIVKKEVE